MTFVRRLILRLLLLSFITFAQSQEGDQTEIKEVVMKGNNITSIVFNYGSVGAPNMFGNIADLVWNRLGYMFEFGPMIAAEVSDENSNVHHIVSDSHIRNFQGDYSLDLTEKWGFLPEPGFSNPNSSEIANSNNPDSWPLDWTSWNGEFGEGILIAENEVFYKMNDFTNAEFPYYPFPEDTTKRGLGVSVVVRIYQFKSGLDDALIIKYFIKNESPKNLENVYFGFMGDPHIGGASDYADDRVGIVKEDDISSATYSKAVKTIYNYDSDMLGMSGIKTGYMSFSFLESPDNLGLTSFHPAVYTNSMPNVPLNDSLMWDWFTSGINYGSELIDNPGDNINHFGTGPFQLNSNETKIVKLAIFLSHDYNDMIEDAVYINYHHHWNFLTSIAGDNGGNDNYKIELTSPESGEYSEDINIEWNYTGTDPFAKVFLEYSPNLGKSWIFIDNEINAADEDYTWNISEVKDGKNILVRLVSYGSEKSTQYYYTISENRFTINKPDENAVPELSISSSFTGEEFITSPVRINFISEDADNSELSLEFEYYSPIFNVWNEIEILNYPSAENSYNWDITKLANGKNYKLRITASDGNNETIVTTDDFEIDFYRGEFNSSIVEHTEGKAEAKTNVEIANPYILTTDSYEVSFSVTNESNKKMSVKNLNTSEILISDYPLKNYYSTPEIDGLKITFHDEKSRIDSMKSGFTRNVLNSSVSYRIGAQLPGLPLDSDNDWILVFNDLDTLSDGSFLYPADTVLTTQFNNIVVPFKLINLDYSEPGNCLIQETIPSTRNNGKWDFGEGIVLRPQNFSGVEVNYGILINKPAVDIVAGDTLKLITKNGITENDKYIITPTNDFVLGIEENTPSDYSLLQNYPNPFNPVTRINYSLKENGMVKISVYDILGRKVKDLISEFQDRGNHSIEFNASSLSSGIYLYRIQSGNFIKTMKMILLK